MFWKYYFRLLSGLFVVGTVTAGYEFREILRPIDGVSWILMVVSLIGLFGYGWNVRIFSRSFWVAFMPIWIAWDYVYETSIRLPELSTVAPEKRVPELILAGIFLLPLYFALLRYSYSDAVASRLVAATALQVRRR